MDESLFLAALDEPSPGPAMRFYRWSEATLSLGYFQSTRDVPPTLAALPLVRRLTGGGAIVHERELTYCLVLPPNDWPRTHHLEVVADVHRALRSAAPALTEASPASSPAEPFLCFERRDRRDLVLGGAKIVGSAQRARRGALLQHGSILLERSSAAPHLPGLGDLQAPIPDAELVAAVAGALARMWRWTFEPGAPTERERKQAVELETAKYSTIEWNRRR